jgi:DnaK suppressor protein
MLGEVESFQFGKLPVPALTLVGFPPFIRVQEMARQLAKTTVDRFRRRLEDEQARLEGQIAEYEREIEEARLTESSSDRSPDPGNAEASSMKLEYAKELSIEQNTLDLLGKVQRALRRVEAGEYGLCESCGKPIPIERLDILPYSTLCVDCASKAS